MQASVQFSGVDFHGLTFDSVNSLYEKNINDADFFRMLNWLIVLAFKQRNYNFLKRIFDLEIFTNSNHYNGTYPKFLDTMLIMGVEMRKQPHLQEYLWKDYARSPISRFIYFEHFVDHDYLPGRHHKGIGEYIKHVDEPDAKLFANCLLFFSNLLQKNVPECKQQLRKINSIKINSSMHPYPVSRMVSYNLLFQYVTRKHIDREWLDYIFLLESEMPRTGELNRNVPIFHMMVSETLVWCEKYDEARLLIEKAIESYPFLNDDSIFGNAAANAKLRTYYAKALLETNQYDKAVEMYQSVRTTNFDVQSKHFDDMHYYKIGSDIFRQTDLSKSISYHRSATEISATFGFDLFAEKYARHS